MNTVGHHTVEDLENPDHVEEHGPFPSLGALAFLGPGYYFWEDSLELGHWWGEVHCGGSYMICEAEINSEDDLFLDLVGKPRDSRHLRKLIAELRDEINREFKNDPVSLSTLIMFLRRLNTQPKTRGIFPFKVIRAVDHNRPSSKMVFTSAKPNYTDLNPRIIICLSERTKVFLPNFKIVFPQKYVLE